MHAKLRSLSAPLLFGLVCATALSLRPAQAACTEATSVLEAQPMELPMPPWRARVQELDQQIASTDLSRVRLLFLGDSITQGWYNAVFDQFYKSRNPLNLGVLGDTTQGLLWRLARLPLGESLRPQLVIVLIGTNDLWPGVDPTHVAGGIEAVIGQIRRRSPGSHILLLGLLPRAADRNDPFRVKLRAVNALLADCADATVSYADPGAMLVDGEGHVSTQVEYDLLHPTWLGYAILATAMEPYVRHVLGPQGEE